MGATAQDRKRQRVLVLNQYYEPGVEATGRLLAQLCSDLADDFNVTVVTGALPNARAGRGVRDGVDVIRIRSTAFARRRHVLRALNYATFLGEALRVSLRRERPDVVLAMTDPPVIGAVAALVARRRRVPLVVVMQDVFPETAERLGRIHNALVLRLLRTLVDRYLRQATRIVAIGDTMSARLIQKGAPAENIVVIPNWVETQALTPAPRRNEWAERNALADGFVVMHSGNVGNAQDLDSLLRAAAELRDLDDVTVAIVGDGVRRDELAARAPDNVRFLPYQPRETLAQTLSAADVHVVGLAAGLAGYVVPSRIYGILATARPVIVAADEESETAQLVTRAGCGVVVPPGRPDLLAQVIRRAYDRELDLSGMGRRGRVYVEAHADRAQAVARYRELLLEAIA